MGPEPTKLDRAKLCGVRSSYDILILPSFIRFDLWAMNGVGVQNLEQVYFFGGTNLLLLLG